MEWALRVEGLNDLEVKELLNKPPTAKHRFYTLYQSACHTRDLYHTEASKRPARSSTDTSSSLPPNLVIVRDFQEQIALLEEFGKDPQLTALDLEWTYGSENPELNSRLIGINLSRADKDYYFPVLGREFDTSGHADSLLSSLWRYCRNTTTVWHNAKADLQNQYEGDPLDFSDCVMHDTILMAYVAGEQKLGLKDLTHKLLGRRAFPLPERLEDQPVELAAKYGAAGDTRNTLDLYHLLRRKLEDTEQWDIYNTVERPLVPLIASMEKFGIPLDMEECQRLRDDYWNQEEAIRVDVLSKEGFDFSDDDQQRAYISAHGFHSNSLDQRVLSKLAASGAEWAKPLLEYRKIRTLRRNFLDKHINIWQDNGRTNLYSLFPSFNQAGRDTDAGSWTNAPATGRLSSAGPNLQNQPRAIRSVFTAPTGCVLVSLDYSALELRLAASISEDKVMLDVLSNGGDLHQYMRERILGATMVDVGRPTAKTANFNLRYGGQADMLVTIAAKEGAHLTYELAEEIVRLDKSTYVGYWKWFDNAISQARVEGYSPTLMGRRRYNSDLRSMDSTRRGHAERAAANMIIQGTGADIIKTAMRNLIPILKYFKAHLALQVHDELVFWVPEEVAERFLIAAKGIMTNITIPHLKLAVEGGAGRTWAEAH